MAGLRGVNIGQTLNFHLKVHFYPYDLTPDQGTLAFLPGSHRYADGIETPNIPEDSNSPVVRRVVPRAGDAVLFNTHLLHMALANGSQHVRKSLIYSYSHFWVKGTISGVPKDLNRLATTPQRRQLFGQPTEHLDEPPFFMKAYETDRGTDIKGFLSAGQSLLRRTLGGVTYTNKR
jgi:ectoine hydroxylase-related dioxygenase (phytanoyl-CoA dioxygenase family)